MVRTHPMRPTVHWAPSPASSVSSNMGSNSTEWPPRPSTPWAPPAVIPANSSPIQFQSPFIPPLQTPYPPFQPLPQYLTPPHPTPIPLWASQAQVIPDIPSNICLPPLPPAPIPLWPSQARIIPDVPSSTICLPHVTPPHPTPIPLWASQARIIPDDPDTCLPAFATPRIIPAQFTQTPSPPQRSAPLPSQAPVIPIYPHEAGSTYVPQSHPQTPLFFPIHPFPLAQPNYTPRQNEPSRTPVWPPATLVEPTPVMLVASLPHPTPVPPVWEAGTFPPQPLGSYVPLRVHRHLVYNPLDVNVPVIQWDVIQNPTMGKAVSGRHVLQPLALDEPAVTPGAKKIYITYDLPYLQYWMDARRWGPIVIEQDRDITVHDLLLAIHDYFQTPLTRQERHEIKENPFNKGRLRHAASYRIAESYDALPEITAQHGYKRSDVLGRYRRFQGLRAVIFEDRSWKLYMGLLPGPVPNVCL